jgi:hypothetical protein
LFVVVRHVRVWSDEQLCPGRARRTGAEANASPSPQDTQGQNSGPANDPQVGKNKLEKETGTVNDRIFEVMPNYGTVETGNDP